ncbi:MAG: NADH dehydrogenase (quinone) subunit G [Phototrophicales bacterium]|nr:MAG: NADH dehydrogenase (quinone) subunit G [Phototrophicales bacterium]
MSEVTIYIDGQEYRVPANTNLVDVAKFYADNDIPVFCYHPKMAPVGMCRMCLVKMGSVEKNRETGEVVTDENGNPKIRWFPKLQTACTQTVYDGLAIITNSEEVQVARDDIIEFILTSHPLDCPICDKGGECPLQNLTMRHGPGQSVFYYEDKMHLDKHVPLGELIYLDRERCIQCARCTRFCDELVGDDVLAFHERGRRLQIVTISDPPFDTKFSGNTTDICPVGALTTADFRFGARPWELKEVPSLDPYGPEGANISLSTRLDRDAGGRIVIKRVMPRQNEYVNEIWISDKTRFGHHHTRSDERLTKPLIRQNGQLAEASWEEAYQVITDRLRAAKSLGVIAGPNQSNEDLWELKQLASHVENHHLGVFPATMSGGDIVNTVGVGVGTNFLDLKKGDVIVVVASDLEEEAPIWYLRTKVARDRGVKLVLLNARPTKLSKYAKYNLTYAYGDAVSAINSLISAVIGAGKINDEILSRVDGYDELAKSVKKPAYTNFTEAAEAIGDAQNMIVLAGSEGLTLAQQRELMQACANLLIVTGHVGRPNNGLIPVWHGANIQGAYDLGFTAEATEAIYQESLDVVLVAGCNPVGEVVEAEALQNANFVVVTSLFETETTAIADVVLPRQSFAERDGTFTSGERRVQRFYTAQGVIGESLPDWRIFAEIHYRLGGPKPKLSAGAVMAEINKAVPSYAEMRYKKLAEVPRQFPDVGGEDLYYGGTAYQNRGGIGQQTPTVAEDPEARLSVRPVEAMTPKFDGLVVIPTTLLYDRGVLFRRSTLMHQRIPAPHIVINPEDAEAQGITDGDTVAIVVEGHRYEVQVKIDKTLPRGAVLMPRRLSNRPDPSVPTVLESIEKIVQPVPVTEG